MTGWAALAGERADLLDERISAFQAAGADKQTLDSLSRKLADVRMRDIDAPHRLAWLTGSAINETWSELYRIEERIDELTPGAYAGKLMHDAERHAEEVPGKLGAELRQQLAEPDRKAAALQVIHEAHKGAEERRESERNLQRGILYFAAGFFAAAIVLIIVQAAMSAWDRIIPLPGNGTTVAGWALLALVMLFGMLGGALSALVSLYMTGKNLTNSVWFDPRPALSLVKIVMGLWTAVLAVLAVGTGVIVGVYFSLASVLLLAFIFGYAQQAVTRYIDRKVADIIGTENL
jgi:uncharacterized membrane protein